MNNHPIYVWHVGDPNQAPDPLHDRLAPRVASYRYGTLRELADRMSGSAEVPDVILLARWDPTLLSLIEDVPRVWLDSNAAIHDEITVMPPIDIGNLITALVTAVNLGRARTVRNLLRSGEQEAFIVERAPLPDLGDFALHFQAQWRVDGQALTGAETLLRWNGLPVPDLRPEAMITAAEHSGDMHRLGDWIVQRACRHAADWRAIWPDSMRLLINISPLQLAADNFAGVLAAALDENHLNPALIELEVPVATLPRLAERYTGVVADLYDLGIGFALDGLGVDVLDPQLLTWLPATAWKLHRDLIARLPHDRAATALVETLTEAAHAQRIMTVAVGVERDDQRELLRELGCDALQGYLFAEALAPEQFAAMLTAHAERRVTRP